MPDRSDVADKVEDGKDKIEDGRETAKEQARKPSAVLSFVIAYVLFASTRFILRADEGWYDRLRRPAWVLSSLGETIGWLAAFALLAYSSVLVFRNASGTKTGALVLSVRIAHFVVLQAFYVLLFALKSLFWAAAGASLLPPLALAVGLLAWRKTPTATWVMGAYSLWTVYTAVSVWALWSMNA